MYNQFDPEELEAIAWDMFLCGEYSAADYEKFCLLNECYPPEDTLREHFWEYVGDNISKYMQLCEEFKVLCW